MRDNQVKGDSDNKVFHHVTQTSICMTFDQKCEIIPHVGASFLPAEKLRSISVKRLQQMQRSVQLRITKETCISLGWFSAHLHPLQHHRKARHMRLAKSAAVLRETMASTAVLMSSHSPYCHLYLDSQCELSVCSSSLVCKFVGAFLISSGSFDD